MRVQCRKKFRRNGEELVFALTVHQPGSVPSPRAVLRKVKVPPLHSRSGKVDLVIQRSKENKDWPGAEWLRTVTEPFNVIQNPFRTINLGRALYPFGVQARRGHVHKTTDVRSIV